MKAVYGGAMGKSFWQRVPLPDGTDTVIHVNRRGCTGPWTAEDDAMMQRLVQAVHAQYASLTPEQRQGWTHEQTLMRKRRWTETE